MISLRRATSPRLARALRLAPSAAFALLIGVASTPVAAQPTYLTSDRLTERAALFEALAVAPNPLAGRLVADRIWRFWMTGPTRDMTARLSAAMLELQSGQYVAAEEALTAIVSEAPEFSEAWNQRAIVRFTVGDYAGSLDDIEQVLAVEPSHFGALAGRARILFALGREAEAQAALFRAVEIHPWIPERRFLPKTEEI